jgi:hypothetical protein
MSNRHRLSRRAVVGLLGTATLTGLTGCASNSQNNELSGPVPKAYRTATSLGGVKRSSGSLTSKAGANYQSDGPSKSKCANCRYYIPDKNGDGLGACSLVEGYIEPKAWCSLYARYQDKQG